MTFSILGRDETGAIGMAVSSSSPAVAARCVHLRPGVGGVASQNITDPRLGSLLLDRLAAGWGAQEALDDVVGSTPDIEHRQLMVIDFSGGCAHFSGAHTLGTHDAAQGAQVVAAGNLLANYLVPKAMIEHFTASAGELEERLISALAAGQTAGGEAGAVRSAGLAVVRDVEWRVTDLRVDDADDPIPRLAELVDLWLPQRDDYVVRGLHPAGAPSFGVPGDE